jgi:hypothetical protein
MIGMAKSCSGGGALGNYVMDERKGYELDRNNLCGSTPKEIIEEMKMIQDLNQRAINKTFSMVISPDIKDGKNLSDDELRGITKDYLNKLGIDTEKQQFVAFVHTEKEHKHVHIIVNRVQPDGKLISDHHIGKRAQWIAHGIAKERGLISAKEKMFENLKNIDKVKDNLKTEIFSKHQAVMKERPQTFQNYINQMKQQGLEVNPTINKQGQLQGFRIRDLKSDKEFKMSEVHRSMSASSLIKSGLKNDLNNSLDNTLKRVNHKHKTNKAVGINKELKSIKKDAAFTLNKEVKSLTNNAEFQIKSTGKSVLKTVLKPSITIEKLKEEIKFRESVESTKQALHLNHLIEYWEDKAKETTLKAKEQEPEQEQKSEPKKRDLEI